MNQKGFTLVELVVVIVVLGILAAVAVPKFVDLKADAQTAALDGVAGSMGSAMAINYAARSANSTKGQTIANCQDVALIMEGGIPAGYTVQDTDLTVGTPADCTVNQTDGGATETFVGIAIN